MVSNAHFTYMMVFFIVKVCVETICSDSRNSSWCWFKFSRLQSNLLSDFKNHQQWKVTHRLMSPVVTQNLDWNSLKKLQLRVELGFMFHCHETNIRNYPDFVEINYLYTLLALTIVCESAL